MRKAKYLKTGETVNVHNIDYCGQGMDVALIEKDGLMKNVSLYDIQFIDSIDEEVGNELTSEIDWENRRYELAKAAIIGLYSKEDEGDISKMRVGASKDLLLVVDELIKQLRQSNEAK